MENYNIKKILKIKVIFVLFSLVLINSINSSNDNDSVFVHELNDSNFDELVNNGVKNPWFVIFYINSCPHCKNAKTSLDNISNNPDRISKTNIKLSMVDCDKNMFVCFRFNISRVPYTVILESNRMFEFSEYPSEENMIKFIREKKDKDNGLPIPKPVGYLEYFFRSLEDLVKILNKTLENCFNNNFGYKIDWRSEYTIVVLILALVVIVVLEVIILNYFFGSNKHKDLKLKKVSDSADVSEPLKENEEEKDTNKNLAENLKKEVVEEIDTTFYDSKNKNKPKQE